MVALNILELSYEASKAAHPIAAHLKGKQGGERVREQREREA